MKDEPKGTPNLWLLPRAISQPNSPGGFRTERASRSVAQHANAYKHDKNLDHNY